MAVEFALAAPVAIMLALGIADYGTLMNKWAALRGATRAGAEYVKAAWNDPAVYSATVAEQRVCSFLGLTLSGSSCSPVTASVSEACTCSDDTSVTCPSATGSNNPCSTYLDSRVLVSVTVSATERFSPIAPWASFVFPSTVSASTVIRTQ